MPKAMWSWVISSLDSQIFQAARGERGPVHNIVPRLSSSTGSFSHPRSRPRIHAINHPVTYSSNYLRTHWVTHSLSYLIHPANHTVDLFFSVTHATHSFVHPLSALILYRFHHTPKLHTCACSRPPRICLFSLEKKVDCTNPPDFFCFQVQCVLGFIWPLHCRQCRYPDPGLCCACNKSSFWCPVSVHEAPSLQQISHFLNSLCFQRRPHWMNSVAGRGDTFQRKVGCMSWVVGSDDKLLISQVLEMEACNTRGLYSKPRLWHEFYLSFRVPLHNRSYISFSAAKVSQHVWVCAMLAATPNKQRWDKLDDGCLPVSAPGLHGRHGRGCQPLLDVFPLYMCFRIFLRVFLFCACAGVCVCVCAFVFSWVSCKVFHDIPAHFFMQLRSYCLGTQLPWTTTQYI